MKEDTLFQYSPYEKPDWQNEELLYRKLYTTFRDDNEERYYKHFMENRYQGLSVEQLHELNLKSIQFLRTAYGKELTDKDILKYVPEAKPYIKALQREERKKNRLPKELFFNRVEMPF